MPRPRRPSLLPPTPPLKLAAKPPAPPPPDPKATALVLDARKRKSTPAIFKIRSRKNTPIVFTLDEVRELIKNRTLEKEKPVKAGDTKAAFLIAKQIAQRNAATKGKAPRLPPAKPRKNRIARRGVAGRHSRRQPRRRRRRRPSPSPK